MKYNVRKAEIADCEMILALYAQARSFMASRGNPTQWGSNRPTYEQTELDIVGEQLYVLEAENRVCGVFAMIPGEDPTYQKVYNGTWHHNLPYAAIHRVAGDGSGGIMDAVFHYGFQKYDYLRIDTHENNIPMRRAIQRAGFLYCGVIITDDGTPRLAFDKRK